MQTRLTPKELAALRRRAKAIATQGHVDNLPTTSTPAPTKLSQVAAHYAAGRYKEALAIAARFPQLGQERDAILEAHGAYANPRFCAQLGKDPVALQNLGILALAQKYGLPAPTMRTVNQ